jgi:Protein of unknown function (DUF3572)
MIRNKKTLSPDDAETIGVRALAFLAEEPERLARFLALTGIGPEDLRAMAGEPAFLAEVLTYLAQDESALLVFAASAALPPEDIIKAEQLLRGA